MQEFDCQVINVIRKEKDQLWKLRKIFSGAVKNDPYKEEDTVVPSAEILN